MEIVKYQTHEMNDGSRLGKVEMACSDKDQDKNTTKDMKNQNTKNPVINKKKGDTWTKEDMENAEPFPMPEVDEEKEKK